ncbi:MAG: acyl-CoA dehydrogenase family protein, partial [Actinomycetota bacterium]
MDLSFTAAEAAFAAEVREWLAANAEPAPRFATIADEVEYGRRWQARMAADRWVGIHWPREFGGRGATPVEVALFNMEYARAGAPQPVNRVGINLTGPTLLACGTTEQQKRWLPGIVDASEIWCQLFSEPDAGSDLASLSTRADRVD